ncbi:glycoside hydrolase family 16 protein [Tulasnella calospora MUT 4182]|uniref:Glycoside hydrolase family 16 protein n=1 Tax=Tulasnella calospora MUT 4182 TaxID=1051891 RepID=A0A0C3K8E5_9AGAM|nr:glycoside hydrolase family 16 protein [Tulasnella calospora MUT 4182]
MQAFSPREGASSACQVDEVFVGDSFLDGFEHEDFEDPTHGRIKIKRADYTTVLDPNGPGRDTVRLSSKKQYGYSIDLRHMPTGYWYVSTNSNNNTWPTAGEIDIIRGVSGKGPNASNHACTQSDLSTDDRGVLVSDKCTSAVGDGVGCHVNHDTDKSYSPELNAVGGGCYAMEPTSQFVNVWFWTRDDENVPDDLKDTATLKQSAKINPDAWSQPQTNFVSSNTCDLDVAIKPQNIIINLTLCGHWAGNAYPALTPPLASVRTRLSLHNLAFTPTSASRLNHVNNDPAAFKDAYWDIASMTILSPTSSGASKRHHHSHKRN